MPPSPASRSSALADKVKVIILTARPGIVIGKKGAEIGTAFAPSFEKVAGGWAGQLSVDVIEIKRPELMPTWSPSPSPSSSRAALPSVVKHAQGRPVRYEGWRQGHPYPVLRSSGRRWVVASGTARVALSAHPARQDRLWHLHRSHHSWPCGVKVWISTWARSFPASLFPTRLEGFPVLAVAITRGGASSACSSVFSTVRCSVAP